MLVAEEGSGPPLLLEQRVINLKKHSGTRVFQRAVVNEPSASSAITPWDPTTASTLPGETTKQPVHILSCWVGFTCRIQLRSPQRDNPHPNKKEKLNSGLKVDKLHVNVFKN